MPDGVRADPFSRERRECPGCRGGMAFNHGMDAETGERVLLAIEENVLRGRPILNEKPEFLNCSRPKWAAAEFIALAANLD